MLVVVKAIKETNAVFFVVRVTLVQAGYEVSLSQTRLHHDLEFVADDFNSYKLLAFVLGYSFLLTYIDRLDYAGKYTFACDATDSIPTLDHLTIFWLVVALVINRRIGDSEALILIHSNVALIIILAII